MKSNDSENDRVFTTGTRAPLEVQELWAKRENHIPGLLSLLAHVIVLTIAITYSVASYIKPKPAGEDSEFLAPFILSIPNASVRSGGGGGGMRASTPASKGVLPRKAEIQLVPPTPIITNFTPQLIADPTIVDIAFANIASRNLILQLGDPNGVPGPPSGGRGTSGGIGDGDDHGIGDGNGPFGPGLGKGPAGTDNPIVNIGKGGATPPSCPLPATEPGYTDEARKGHVQGTVILNVIVNKDGTVSVSEVAQRLGYGLDDEASRFVAKNFRCRPGVYQGQAVATPVRIDVNFHLY